VIGAPDGRVVATTDLLIEGRHFRRDWSAAADIGHKAAARNLADVAAMGARPTALLVGFAGPGDLAVDWVIELIRGIAEECVTAGATVAGGDTSSAETIMLAITALGDLGGRPPVLRGGARPGDVLALAGTLGGAAAGLALLAADLIPDPRGGSAGLPGGSAGLPGGSAGLPGGDVGPLGIVGAGPAGADLAALAQAHRRPRPPYDAGPQAAALGATSMIDISDGLVADLGHVADASGAGIEVRSSELLAKPVAHVAALRAAAELVSADWTRWVLTGGEDHALAATFPARVNLPERWTVVGQVTEGSGVLVDGRSWAGSGGWDHFRDNI
jgi:thiamine-monophosphate kinase